jgi:hypothetical protein
MEPRLYPDGVTAERSLRTRCNIGPAEIERRRRSALAFTLLAGLVAVGLLALAVPIPARLAFFPFATAAAITWLQVAHRFCVAFGAFGLENFGDLGEEEKADPAMRAVDRRRVAQLLLEGSAFGAAATLLFVIVPV